MTTYTVVEVEPKWGRRGWVIVSSEGGTVYAADGPDGRRAPFARVAQECARLVALVADRQAHPPTPGEEG